MNALSMDIPDAFVKYLKKVFGKNGAKISIKRAVGSVIPVPDYIHPAWVQIESRAITSQTSTRYSDYNPRYYYETNGWTVILPTQLGNIEVSIRHDSLVTTSTVTVSGPDELAELVREIAKDPVQFIQVLKDNDGGVDSDETLGRLVELEIYRIPSTLLPWILIASAGLTGLYYYITGG